MGMSKGAEYGAIAALVPIWSISTDPNSLQYRLGNLENYDISYVRTLKAIESWKLSDPIMDLRNTSESYRSSCKELGLELNILVTNIML
jgi:hypothetical protein